ncbi:hypothetical protein FBQ82_12220 [Anaerolineae bacterium CFX7]|nr:hypothetical protein [Anaerolineae bacterium CFX7]
MSALTKPVKPKRPFTITFVALWIFLAALVDLFYGALLFASTDFIAKPPDARIVIEQERAAEILSDNQLIDAAEGILYMTLGVVQVALGFSFWLLKRWAWVGVMTWQALGLLIDLSGILNGNSPPAASLALAIALVFLLNQSSVRQVFGIRSLTNESKQAPPPPRAFNSN